MFTAGASVSLSFSVLKGFGVRERIGKGNICEAKASHRAFNRVPEHVQASEL